MNALKQLKVKLQQLTHHHHTHIKKTVLFLVVGEAALGIILVVFLKHMDAGMFHLTMATLVKDLA